MKLLPQSLFGRLMWVLLAGLIVTQLLSAAINFEERDQLLLKTSGIQSAARIADTVQLLDSLNPAERKRIVAILNVPPQVVTLDRLPMAPGSQATSNLQSGMFSSVLKATLGEEREIRVAQSATPASTEQRGPGSGYGRRRAMMEGKEFVPGMYRFSHDAANASGASFVAQVQLRDGHWVTFDTYVPKDSASLPLRLLITLVVLLLAVLALSFVAVRWITRPLHVLASAAEALGTDINQPPLPENGPIEVRQAARAFNSMQTNLKNFIQDRTRIFSAMSHDLKTPITRLRLRSEMLDDDELRQRFENDLKEMESMVTQSLDFMRGIDSMQARHPIDIMALLESLQADFAEMGRIVSIEGETIEPFVGVPQLLKRGIANLLENAIVYGQQAEVIIEDNAENLILRIRDYGPGIPESAQEKVFEPFYRLEASRNRETGGTGLGLTIARSIAQSHGGSIALKNRPEGGLEITLKLKREHSNTSCRQ